MNKKRTAPPAVSLRVLLIAPYLVLIALTAAVVSVAFYYGAHGTVEALLARVDDQVARRIEEELTRYLSIPLSVVDHNAELVRRGLIDIEDPVERDRYFSAEVERRSTLAMSFFGTPNGEFYGARRNAAGDIEVVRNNSDTGGASEYFRVNTLGDAAEASARFANFDCRTRPWYTAAVESGRTVFSPVYKHFVFDDLAITASTPVYDDSGELVCVLGADLLLGGLNAFLNHALSELDGLIILSEADSCTLIANSDLLPNFRVDADGALQRVAAADLSGDHATVVEWVVGGDRTGDAVAESGGSGQRGDWVTHEIPVTTGGVDWRLTVALTTGQFMGEFRVVLQATVFVGAATVLVSIAVGLLLAGAVTRPLSRLVDTAGRISRGDWGVAPVEVRGAQEVVDLAHSFRTMADDLKGLVDTLEERVAERTAELEESNHTKDKFFAIIAHDLRGPLSSLSLLMQDVVDNRDSYTPDELSESLSAISESSRTVYSLLENLLAWARNKRNEMPFDPKPVNIDEIIGEAIDVLHATAEAKSVHIVENRTPVGVVCDRNMISTVYRNLLSNAIKYTPAGGTVEIGVLVGGENQHAAVPENQVEVYVADDGLGMTADEIDRLTRRMGRSRRGTAGEPGSGLGLVLSAEFLDAHGTRLVIESRPDEGSRFSFLLPLQRLGA